MKPPSASCPFDNEALLADARGRPTAFGVPQFATPSYAPNEGNLVPIVATHPSRKPFFVECHGFPIITVAKSRLHPECLQTQSHGISIASHQLPP